MKIGIDARLIEETGVGRYIKNLVGELGRLDRKNQYVVFLRKKSLAAFQLPNKRWEKRLAEVPWHSFQEQLVMPWILVKEHLDLLHVPYFNIPIFYPGKFIVTIHDFTILHFDTGRATTLPWLFYKIRRLGYYLDLAVGLKRAQHIFAVSAATKREIVDHFKLDPAKISVTHEAVEANPGIPSAQRLIKEPYFLYVGNAYPHKNLERLLVAFKQLKTPTKLVFVGPADFFYERLKQRASQMSLTRRLIFYGSATQAQLRNLYSGATALVFPSLMEGFGLPGLEAMAAGTPVVCSDIPIFHEIYGDAALYFDPKNEEDVISKLQTIVSDKKLREDLIGRGKEQVKRYSWKEMAIKTLQTYNA